MTTYIVMAYIIVAYIVMTQALERIQDNTYSYGLHICGLYSYDPGAGADTGQQALHVPERDIRRPIAGGAEVTFASTACK